MSDPTALIRQLQGLVRPCSGSPENVITAPPGCLACDKTNGKVYKKGSGTGNTGWVELGAGGGGYSPPIPQSDVTNLVTDLAAKLPTSYLDTDGTLAANSDSKIASQKATKTYADTKLPLAGGTLTGTLTTVNLTVNGSSFLSVRSTANRFVSPSTNVVDFYTGSKRIFETILVGGNPEIDFEQGLKVSLFGPFARIGMVVTSSAALVSTDPSLIVVDASAGSGVVVDLPSANLLNQTYKIINRSSFSVTVTCSVGSIEGSGTVAANKTADFTEDGNVADNYVRESY